jgi:hypothetical protein
VPEDSNAWRVYQVLCYRFEEQSSQDDVAAQMTVSARQVRRLEQTAIRALASQIAAQFGLRFMPDSSEKNAQPAPIAEEIQPDHEQELDWLRKTYTPDNANIYQLVESALQTGEPMLTSSCWQPRESPLSRWLRLKVILMGAVLICSSPPRAVIRTSPGRPTAASS